jgi:hypothetical protein
MYMKSKTGFDKEGRQIFPVDSSPTIEEILRVFQELKTGTGKDPREDPLKMDALCAFRAADEGLTVPELVEILIQRELTDEEEDFVVLQTEEPEGHA